MRALELNLATRPFRNNTLVWIGLLLAFGLVAGSISWSVWTFVDKHAALVDLRDRVGKIDAEFAVLDVRESRAKREAATVDLRSLRFRTEKANEVIRAKAFSWTRLFNELEAIQPNDVRMTSVHPVFMADRGRAGRGETELTAIPVSVEGIARDLADFFAFERALLANPQFARVEPGRVNRSERGDEIQFDLAFLYDPVIAEGRAEPNGEAGAVGMPTDGKSDPQPVGDVLVLSPDVGPGPGATTGAPEEPPVEPDGDAVVVPPAPGQPGKGRAANPPTRRRPRGTN